MYSAKRTRCLLPYLILNFRLDQVRLNCEINTIRSDLKVKVNNLREKEGHDELKGFGLQALSKEEMNGVRQVITPKH